MDIYRKELVSGSLGLSVVNENCPVPLSKPLADLRKKTPLRLRAAQAVFVTLAGVPDDAVIHSSHELNLLSFFSQQAWRHRLANRPILTGTFLRPSPFNKPLPRMRRQPLALSMMIRKRRAAHARRIEQQEVRQITSSAAFCFNQSHIYFTTDCVSRSLFFFLNRCGRTGQRKSSWRGLGKTVYKRRKVGS